MQRAMQFHCAVYEASWSLHQAQVRRQAGWLTVRALAGIPGRAMGLMGCRLVGSIEAISAEPAHKLIVGKHAIYITLLDVGLHHLASLGSQIVQHLARHDNHATCLQVDMGKVSYIVGLSVSRDRWLAACASLSALLKTCATTHSKDRHAELCPATVEASYGMLDSAVWCP